MAERLICNQDVVGSNPSRGSIKEKIMIPKNILKLCLLNVIRACKRYDVNFNELLREITKEKKNERLLRQTMLQRKFE